MARITGGSVIMAMIRRITHSAKIPLRMVPPLTRRFLIPSLAKRRHEIREPQQVRRPEPGTTRRDRHERIGRRKIRPFLRNGKKTTPIVVVVDVNSAEDGASCHQLELTP
jgi:hypothetical protein